MRLLIRSIARFLFSYRTRIAIKLDLFRLRTRLLNSRRQRVPQYPLMHLASGTRRVPGWVNVDLAGADVNVDLSSQLLPFVDESFDAVVCQHLIEHLDLEEDLFPIFRDVCRVMKPGGELWVTTPDLEKIAKEYVKDGGRALYEYNLKRDPGSWPEGFPHQYVVNRFFYQRSEHKNLFDFAIMQWALEACGFREVTRVEEADILRRFPGFPARNDDFEALAVRCVKPQ